MCTRGRYTWWPPRCKGQSQREEVDRLAVDEAEVHDPRPERAHHLVLPAREGLLELAHHLGTRRREVPALSLVRREIEEHGAAAHLVLHELPVALADGLVVLGTPEEPLVGRGRGAARQRRQERDARVAPGPRPPRARR